MPRVAQRTLTGQTISVGEARRYVSEAAADIVYGAAVGGHPELAVGELVTTAVEHAHGAPFAVVVALTADPPTVAISVRSP